MEGAAVGSEPLYLRVERDLASRISDGAWQPGDYLPSEQALQQRYQVSRTTIRKAVGDLVIDGLLEIDRGNGTRVTRGRDHQPDANIMSFSASMRAMGRRPGVRNTHACLCEAEAAEQASSEVVDSSRRLVHISRVHTADDDPVSASESWLPASAFAGVDVEGIAARESLYTELSALDVGITRVSDRYGIADASQTEAALLDVAPGTPLLCVDRIGYTANNRPIETSRIVVRTDLYRPTITTRSR